MKKIMNKFNEFKKARELNEDGFSLIELVVAVGILAILSVVGLIAYSQITDNARTQAVKSAASDVYVAAVAYEANGDDAASAATEWNAAAGGDITVEVGENDEGEIAVKAEGFDRDAYKGATGADDFNSTP